MKDDSLFRLDNRTIVIVGAGSGIGEACARACARQGADVIAVDLDAERAQRTAASVREMGHSGESVACDIGDADAVNALFDGLMAHNVDGVVSTPAINVRKSLLRYSDDEFDRVLRLNLKGTFNVLRA